MLLLLFSRVQLFAASWSAACQAPLSITLSWSLFRFMVIELVMLSNHLILCHPLLCPPSFPTSGSFPMSQLFASGDQNIGTSSICPSSEYSGLISFRVWSPCIPRESQESSPAPQFESINSSALSLLYGPTLTSIHDYWKTIALTIWIFVSKVMSLLLIHCLGLS